MPTMTADSSQQQLPPSAEPSLRQTSWRDDVDGRRVVRPLTTPDDVAALVGRGVAGEAASYAPTAVGAGSVVMAGGEEVGGSQSSFSSSFSSSSGPGQRIGNAPPDDE